MRALSAAALILRRLRGEAGIVLLLFLLVATTSFLFAAAPRLFNRVTDDAMRYAVATATPLERNVWVNASGQIGAGNQGGVSAIRAYGEARSADFAPSISRLISDRSLGVTSVRLSLQQSIISISLRYQDGVTDDARLVAGQWPVDRGQPLHQVYLGQVPNDQAPPAVFEAALSTDEAAAIGVHLGDVLKVDLDRSDSLVPPSSFRIAPTQIEIVGLFEPVDPKSDEWNATGLLQATFKRGPDGVEAIYATALMAPEAYPSLAVSALPFHFDWRFHIDADKLDPDFIDSLQPDLRRLDLIAATDDHRSLSDVSAVVALKAVTIRSDLLGILDRFTAQQARSESILSIAALGPIGLAAGALAMLAVLLVRPRRGTLLLARGRGASGTLLLGTQLGEAIVLAGSAALVGLLLAVYAVPARDTPLSPILAFAAAAGTTLLLLAATWPTARRPLIQLERDDPGVLGVSARRLVLEATVVVIAILGIVLLRQRGLTLGSVTDTVQFDPLLAAVPLLAGLAAGIALMRLYPLPVRGLGWLAARRRDLIPVVGLRAVARRPSSANLPLVVLMLTAAFGAFASVIETSIDRGQVAASYLEVGGDYRLEAVGTLGLPASFDPTSIPGVSAAAAGFEDATAAYVGIGKQRAGINLEAIDAAALQEVTTGTAAATEWPSAFLTAPPVVDVGTPTNPIPAIISADFPPGTDNLNTGDTFTISVARKPLIFRVVQRGSAVLGLADTANFAVVPLNWLQATEPGASLEPTVMWLRGSQDAAGPLTATVSAASSGVRIVARQDALALLHDAPLGSAVADGFGIALSVAVLYLVLTLVGAVILSASGRTRDLAYLRTLGVSARQAFGLTTVENVPPVLLAVVPGVLLGVAVAYLVEPGLGLSDFVGAQGLPLYLDLPTLVLVIVALTLVVVVAILLGTWLAGRARLANTLRIEDS